MAYFNNQILTWNGSDTAAGTLHGRISYQTNTTVGSTIDTNTGYWDIPSGDNHQFNVTSTNTWTGTAQFDFNTTGTADTTVGFIVTGVDWQGFSLKGSLKNALMQIFEKVPKDLIKGEEDAKLVKAKARSEKLLKQWLSPAEYKGLQMQGEIEIPSKMEEDVIFIIKKDPNAMVEVKKKGQFSHRLCAVAEDLDFPVGDQLLSKVALIKTDEKSFREIAIRHV